MQLWEYREHTREEINQRRDEGADVAALEAEHGRLLKDRPEDLERWSSFYDSVFSEASETLESDEEPSTLDAIRALRPKSPRRLQVDAAALPDKALGAWYGRIAGCILGKPVEGKPKAYIDRFLSTAGMDDLTSFFPLLDPWPEGVNDDWLHHPWILGCLEGHISRAERDDDIDYTILGLHYVEKYGPDFTAANVAEEWLNLLPFHTVFTAERVAYRNLVNGLTPPESATKNNPYREWIGAQIRADAFGYIGAGNPERAAEFAFRDACVSHVRNGIYGEMWSAATIAASFSTSDPREALEIGLSEIPAKSRLAEAGRKLLQWSTEFSTWEACWERAQQDYGSLHWVHTINNALWVMIGLLYGGGDFGRTIGIAVRCGNDTDCNGATAGSILGAMLGANAIPDRWKAPFNDTVQSYVIGFDNSRITDLANRTVAQWERVNGA